MRFLAFDFRDVVRTFRRDRAYAVTVVLTLALALGATTAVYSIVDGVLLKPLAYPAPDRLVAIREIWREFVDRYPTLDVNERHVEHWRTHARSFESLAQYLARPANLTGRADAVQVSVVRASGSLFDVLGVQAAAGRTLRPSDDAMDAPEVATIADAFWRRRLGGDPDIIGKSIVLDGRSYIVVGVLPANFRLPRGGRLDGSIDAFVPLRITVGWVGDHNNEAIGRLRAGVTPAQAQAELDVLQRQVSDIAGRQAGQPVTLSSFVTPLADHVAGASSRGLLLLLAAVGAVLLIACANLASLALTRTLGRLREAAIRSALGASRWRLIRRTILEQLLLAAVGGALGVWIAWMALGVFIRTAPVDLPRVDDVTLDARVLLFGAIVSLLTGLLLAAVPAARIAGRDVQAALRAGAGAVASDRRGLRSHALLLVLQVGLSVMLLVLTALFASSFLRVLNADRGFAADNVLAVDVALPAARYADEPSRQAAYDRLLAALHVLSGVSGASTTSLLPLRGTGQVNFVAVEGSTAPMSELPSANFRFVAPEFFRTLGIAIRQGRSFSGDERSSDRPAPAVVSEPTAARLWPGANPIGKRFSRGLANEQGFEVVGVAVDARTTTIDGTQPLMVYVPYWWRSRNAMSVLIKTAVEPASLLPAVRRVIREVDPEIAVGDSRPLEQLVDASLSGRRYQTQLFGAFGAAALFIATVGVYAVASYGVSRRRREMNIRVALGADRVQVVGLVLRQGMAPVVAGVAAGACGAVAIGGVVASLLFEVRARDPFVIAAVVSIVAVVGLATCAQAARRGLALDPAAALRDE